MRRIVVIGLVYSLSFQIYAQELFTEYRETMPAFGLCLMPNNTSFLTLDADYDGMYFMERELADMFELNRFNYSDELINWTYYDYWILNNRGVDVPREKIFFNMVVDPQGVFVAVNLKSTTAYNTEISIYNLETKSLATTVDIFDTDENVEHISFLKFDVKGKNLLVGSEAHGSFSINLSDFTVAKITIEDNFRLIDYDYNQGAMYFAPFTIDDYGVVTFGQGFIKKTSSATEKISSYPAIRDYTKYYTPGEMNKLFTPFYRQSYDTYITSADSPVQMILYRNLETFQLITFEKEISLK